MQRVTWSRSDGRGDDVFIFTMTHGMVSRVIFRWAEASAFIGTL